MDISCFGKSSKLLSFILPVYNVEAWVGDCLDSLLHQDIPRDKYELICVNDGSTDNTAAVLADYASRFDNIKVFEQANSGVSAARNRGLDEAAGKYVWFVDPDDKIRADFLGYLFDKLTDEDAVYLGYTVIEENDIGLKRSPVEPVYYPDFDFRETASAHKLGYFDSGVGNSACLCVLGRRFLCDNGIRFDERLRYAEDTYFCFLIEINRRRQSYADIDAYYYRMRSGSAMKGGERKRAAAHFDSMVRMHELYTEALADTEKGYDDETLLKLRVKKNHAAENAVFDILCLDKREFKSRLGLLKEKNIYPHRFRKENLKLKLYPSKKQKLIALLRFPLPIEPYTRALAAIIRRHGS